MTIKAYTRHYSKRHDMYNNGQEDCRVEETSLNYGRVKLSFDTNPMGKGRWATVIMDQEDLVRMACKSSGSRRALIDHLLDMERTESDERAERWVDSTRKNVKLKRELEAEKKKNLNLKLIGG